MHKIKEFYNSFSFIIVFMFFTVLISALFGEKFLNKFLLLVLASQLLLNVDEAVKLFDKFKMSNEKINNSDKDYSGDVKDGKIK